MGGPSERRSGYRSKRLRSAISAPCPGVMVVTITSASTSQLNHTQVHAAGCCCGTAALVVVVVFVVEHLLVVGDSGGAPQDGVCAGAAVTDHGFGGSRADSFGVVPLELQVGAQQ